MSLLELDNVSRTYQTRNGFFGKPQLIHAVRGVSLRLERGRTIGLVGESGCGKSSTGRIAVGLDVPNGGMVKFDGAALPAPGSSSWRALRRRMQLVFQDPLGALDRRMPIGAQIIEPLIIHNIGTRAERRERALALLNAVGLRPDQAQAHPQALSGGQRQRAVIARALITEPDLLVCDEPVSALDVSIQAQVVNLLADFQKKLNLAILFISHDLKLVSSISDEIVIMYHGEIVESGSPATIHAAPAHPYTRALLAAIPNMNRSGPRPVLAGEVPDPALKLSGCAFRHRCPEASSICKDRVPTLQNTLDGRLVACHHPCGMPQRTNGRDIHKMVVVC